jgi:hypothetical protein
MSYIKSLKSLRKELANEASQEPAAPEAPVSRGFASRSAMPAPQAPQELRYDPSLYVKTAMRRIQESRAAFSERTAEAAKKAMEKAPEKAAKASPIAALTAAVMEDVPKPILDKDGSRPGMADREGGTPGANQSLHVDVAAFEREGVDVLAMSQAVKDIESGGGNYKARGPVVESGRYKGERALGAYQVMPGNLPSWSKAALGREVSEEEFLASETIQDTIFLDQMTKSIDRYGSAEDAVSVWFTGRPVAEAGDATDGYTTASGYNAKYIAGYNKRTRT